MSFSSWQSIKGAGYELATASLTVLLLYLGAVKPHHRRADPLSALGREPTAAIAAKPGETGGLS
jgi:hypothetical protein